MLKEPVGYLCSSTKFYRSYAMIMIHKNTATIIIFAQTIVYISQLLELTSDGMMISALQ